MKMPGVDPRRNGGAPATAGARRITRLTILLALAVFATSLCANLPHALGLEWLYQYVPPFDGQDLSMLDHLGGEHRSIAEALSAGRGFADPFHEPTGPTAWVAPVLPAIQASLLAVGGLGLAVIAIAFLQNLSLIFTGWLVLRTAARCRWRHAPVVSLVLFVVLTWSHFSSSYQFTHDAWLVMSLVGILFYLADRLWTSSFGPRSVICWGLVGGVAMLSAPVFGPVWLALTVLLALRSRRARPFVVSCVIATATMTPWIVRNAIVFGRFIPVKSNLFFEVYQSNALERDGVLRDVTGNTHPFRIAGTERSRYRELGEMTYLDEYRVRSLEVIRNDPVGYLARVKNRLLAATLVYHSFFGEEGKRQVLVRSVIYPLPFLGLAAVVLTRGWARDHLVVIALVIYVTYLMPYVLVAYYRRYAMPLIGLQVMFEIWGLDAVVGHLIHHVHDGNSRSSTGSRVIEKGLTE
jgi:hypothetical protein